MERLNHHNLFMKSQEIQKTGFAIQPKMDCPHLNETTAQGITEYLSNRVAPGLSTLECTTCKDTTQNWICLQCRQVYCSRYVKEHMVQHNGDTKHPVALSFSDGSYWCYDCESYIDSQLLRQARKVLTQIVIEQQEKEKNAKEGKQTKQTEQQIQEMKKLNEEINKMNLKEEQKEKKVTYEQITQGLKNKSYKKVLVLTGAGLSVGAGIPDFRSPGTGLYSKLQKFKLPYPEAIFQLSFYKKQPQAFISLAKQFLSGDYKPTVGHHFIKKLQDENILLKNMTQNIDDLQIKAGLKQELLLQAHGHSRSAHCTICKKQISIESWKQSLNKEELLKCQCQGLVKPDIVFFGEQLPNAFHQAPQIVESCDLAIIIGTSLKVMPFAFLADLIPKQAPTILINNQDSLMQRKNKVWLSGDIQQNIEKLMKDIEWK